MSTKIPWAQRQIKVISPARKIDAVFYCPETGTVVRDPVIALVLKFVPSRSDPTVMISHVEPIRAYKEGIEVCEDLEDISNFLGYEYDGKLEDWSEEINKHQKI